jgi:hypothetical protein
MEGYSRGSHTNVWPIASMNWTAPINRKPSKYSCSLVRKNGTIEIENKIFSSLIQVTSLKSAVQPVLCPAKHLSNSAVVNCEVASSVPLSTCSTLTDWTVILFRQKWGNISGVPHKNRLEMKRTLNRRLFHYNTPWKGLGLCGDPNMRQQGGTPQRGLHRRDSL